MSGDQPSYNQIISQKLVKRLNEAERRKVIQEDLDHVAQDLSDNPLPEMLCFWNELKPNQRNTLSLLGEVLEDSVSFASAEMMANFAAKHSLEYDVEEFDLERILDNLFTNEVLERESTGEGRHEYRFRVDLLRFWVRRAHSIWQD
jgi:hypothetical protein